MSDVTWILGLRSAGLCQLLTLGVACFTPVPRDWDANLATLPLVHRRFAVAQNIFIGGVIAFLGVVSLLLAPDLVHASASSRALCAGTALWWGGRLLVLPWLRVWPELTSVPWRLGFVLLHVECAVFGLAYGWLAIR